MTESSALARRELFAIQTQARLWQAIVVAASIGVPDALRGGQRTTADVARDLGVDEMSLYRLLRALAAGGVLLEAERRTFSLTDTGQLLRTDAPGSMRDWARYSGRPYVQEAWSHFEHSIRTGENSFTALHGEDLWSWRAHEPAERALFDGAMAAMSAELGPALASSYDFGSGRTVADIGGGSGTLLASILAQHPSLRGILFDQADVVNAPETLAILQRAGVAARSQRVSGSFFESVPGADTYLLKAILHDWPDVDAHRILRTIRAAARPTSTLLVVEAVIGPPNEDLLGKIADLNMLAMLGGRERTEPEWRELLDSGGFRLTEIHRLTPRWSVLVASPTADPR